MVHSVQAGVHSQIKLLQSVLFQSDTGSGSLCIVDQHIDTAESSNGLCNHVSSNSFVVGAGADISLNGQNLHTVQTLQLFLCVFQLLDITTGDDDVGTFLCVGSSDAVADGAAAAIGQSSAAGAGDDDGFTSKITHNEYLLVIINKNGSYL